jgi:Tfp pilus assembly protein PilW
MIVEILVHLLMVLLIILGVYKLVFFVEEHNRNIDKQLQRKDPWRML